MLFYLLLMATRYSTIQFLHIFGNKRDNLHVLIAIHISNNLSLSSILKNKQVIFPFSLLFYFNVCIFFSLLCYFMYDLYINVKTKLNLYILFYSVFTRRDLYTVKMPYKIKFYPISFLYTIYLLNIDKSSSNCIKN